MAPFLICYLHRSCLFIKSRHHPMLSRVCMWLYQPATKYLIICSILIHVGQIQYLYSHRISWNTNKCDIIRIKKTTKKLTIQIFRYHMWKSEVSDWKQFKVLKVSHWKLMVTSFQQYYHAKPTYPRITYLPSKTPKSFPTIHRRFPKIPGISLYYPDATQ